MEKLTYFILHYKKNLVEDLKNFKDHAESGTTVEPFNFEYDRLIVTIDDLKRIDKGLGPQIYDAFVLFENDDIAFATGLIEIMENKYNLKFCVKERDLIAGKSEHEAIIKLITERFVKQYEMHPTLNCNFFLLGVEG